MTREELNKLIMQACKRTWNEKTCKEIEQALSQEPCTDAVSEKEQKPCKYCDEDGFCLTQNLCISQRTICNKYYAEQEPCDNAVSREWLKTAIHNFYYGLKHTPTEEDIQAYIDVAPSVNPQYSTGNEFFNFDAPIVKKSMEQDAISRQAAIKIAKCISKKAMPKYLEKLPSVTQKSETVTEFADRCRECGTRYGRLLKEKTDWIPVSERLPEDMCHVWLTCISKVDDREPWVCEGFYNPYYHGTKYSKWGNIPMLNWDEAEVIAWMEQDIPEPYKAESEEQTE